MTEYFQDKKQIDALLANPDCMPVAKLPLREMVTKCVPGEKYFCTDTSSERVAKEGEALITRFYPNGEKDTYINKKGPKYQFEAGEDGKPVTWDSLQPGQSAYGQLKDGSEYDRVAILANPKDLVHPVWGDPPQEVQRPNAFITVVYTSHKFDTTEDGKWESVQIILNNNGGDLHPIDLQRKDENGNPVVIGKLPLTADPNAKEAELRAYVDKYYKGEMPKHLLPVIRNINAEKSAKAPKAMSRNNGNGGK